MPTPSFFFSNATATPEIYTLSLHDALPISTDRVRRFSRLVISWEWRSKQTRATSWPTILMRSEEHTSELQSHHDLVCRLLLEKKKKKRQKPNKSHQIQRRHQT